LHDLVDDLEISALESKAFHEALKPYADPSRQRDAEGNCIGWGIAIGPSVQHFKPPTMLEGDGKNGGEEPGCDAKEGARSQALAGTYTPGAHALTGHHQMG
jgi:hypothetical protein